ncbi:MAG: CoA transferase [Gemmataceae bacterium]|nr:CoA transferase [Gemmataceae bacterium]
MGAGPLADVVVIDLTRVLAGPFCTMMLAELGARVIKVENPDGGDDSRRFGPFVEGRSAYFLSLNRGKESVALNLKDKADRAVLRELVRRGDVLVENFRPGTLDRLGLGYERLREVNPRLIYAAVSGFGDSGPWRERPAYDMIVQAASGLMSITGHPGSPPTKAGTSVGDITGGLFLLAGITSALYHRERTGAGLKVDVSMLDGQIAILESAVQRYATTGQVPGPIGNRHPSIAPFEPYDTADRPLIVAVGNDGLFARLCAALGHRAWAADARFATNADRARHVEALKGLLESVLRTAPAAYWTAVFEAAGVPCSPINTVADAVEHPQVQARNMIVRAGTLRMAGNPIKFDAFPDPPTRRLAPDLDEDGERIRAEVRQDPKAGPNRAP